MQCELYVRWFYIQSEYGKIRSKQPRIRTPFTQFELHVRWFCIQSENGKNTEQKKTDFGYFDPEWWWLYSIALLVLEINETENLARKWVKRQGRADASFKATAWERNPSKCYLELLLKDFVLYVSISVLCLAADFFKNVFKMVYMKNFNTFQSKFKYSRKIYFSCTEFSHSSFLQ